MEAGMSELRPDTLAVRGGQVRSAFDETSEGLFLTSGYVYTSAQEAEAAFKDEIDRFVYSLGLFLSCFGCLDEILPRCGVETVFVYGSDLDQWREALSRPAAAVF